MVCVCVGLSFRKRPRSGCGARETGDSLRSAPFAFPLPLSVTFFSPSHTLRTARTRSQVIHLGDTHLAPSDLPALIDDMRATYHAAAYRLLGRVQGGLNCNDFADDLAHLLVGTGIPAHITSLPAEVLATPFGAALLPMLGGVEAAMGGMREEGGAAPSAQPALAAGLEVAAGAAAIADAPAAAVEASGSPRAAAALAAETAAPTLAAAEDAVRAAAASAHPSDARAAFEDLVRREFDDALASGAASTPNEAAQVALERATAAVRARAG